MGPSKGFCFIFHGLVHNTQGFDVTPPKRPHRFGAETKDNIHVMPSLTPRDLLFRRLMPVSLSFNGAFLFSSMHSLCARTASNANPFPMHNRKAAQKPIHFLLNLSSNLRLGVGDLDSQLLGTSNDVNSLSGRDVVGDPGIFC